MSTFPGWAAVHMDSTRKKHLLVIQNCATGDGEVQTLCRTTADALRQSPDPKVRAPPDCTLDQRRVQSVQPTFLPGLDGVGAGKVVL